MNYAPMSAWHYVLIETYWNVKARESVAPHTEHLSINRNILECKDFQYLRVLDDSIRINRNILECKGGFINGKTI